MTATAIKERPIPFTAPMVRAILDGRKTQTRRVVKMPNEIVRLFGGQAKAHAEPWPQSLFWVVGMDMHGKPIREWQFGDYRISPNYQPGDRLWVREAWLPDPPIDGSWDYYGFTDGEICNFDRLPERFRNPNCCIYAASWNDVPHSIRWRNSRFMFRWASRITLEITEVRVERLQDISRDDAIAEGINADGGDDETRNRTSVENYAVLWDSINSKTHPWASNPWVWVIEFRPLPAGK